MEHSGQSLEYVDPYTGKKFIPHVIEPAVGINRLFLMLLSDAYSEDGDRIVLKLNPKVAPYKVAVFPLLANKPELAEKAREIYQTLKKNFVVTWDDRGNIGKRYFAQDEIGTPWCVTVDFQSLDDATVTVRDRDTAKQERINIDKLTEYFQNRLR
jgi:glycyl-tRNA synthetase